MKKLCITLSLAMAALLSFSAVTWAQEASVFDSVENVVIRAYIVPGTSGSISCSEATPCSAYLEVRNSDGNFLVTSNYAPDGIIVKDVSTGQTVPPDSSGPNNKYLLHDNNLTNSDISMYLDSDSGITYVFCTDDTWHVMKFQITNSANVVDGECGTTKNSCTSGTFEDAPDSDTTYYWNCNGINGGNNASSCSLEIPVDGQCGTTMNSCASGTFRDDDDTPTQSKWSCLGAYNGQDASCSVTKVNGVCGTANGQSFTTLSSTSANLCSSGTVSSFQGNGPWSWICQGSNGGSNSPTCQATTAAQSDLTVTSYSAPGMVSSSYSFSATVTVANMGLAASGPFNVRIYISSEVPANGTMRVSGLAPGESRTLNFTGLRINGLPVHTYYRNRAVADADNEVSESNEDNNESSRWVEVM
jgi:hypothetical protein